MKKKIQKLKEIEKANAEIETPKNTDFIEISMPNEELDIVAQKQYQLLSQRNDPVLRKHWVRRQEKLLRKVFKAASQVLTESQFQVFVMKFVYGLINREIADQLGKDISYPPRVLKACVKKIQKKLRVEENLKWFSGNYLDNPEDDLKT
jgi:DNA-directed RNA polymerase specialized sigma24 family protein